ncbi:MAG: prepilin-type N-terminal cleavage/methylation domain-containing protein [Gammaproteobacteria bacterium]|nr:prepilin-type N-terminal cleavage/methylation domain-containing protein [Gammaproteobacteria bacterium]
MKVLTHFKNNRGFTLIELIVAMVVISVALAGVMSVINYTTLHSADPVLRHQAIATAEAYMEEITLKDYTDPDDGAECPVSEASRDLYDNVCDYNGLSDSGAVDQNGNAISGLENYSVNVSVAPDTYGPSGATTAGLKIDVTVVDPGGESLTLTGYRANY